MDDSVICLDSSEDEAAEPKPKKMSNKSPKKNNTIDGCVVGQRILVSNKHITITKSGGKPTNTAMVPITKTSLSHLHHTNNNTEFTNTKKLANIQNTDGKHFRTKLSSGELTIMPVTSSAKEKTIAQNKSNATVTKSKPLVEQKPQQKRSIAITMSPVIPIALKRIKPIKISDHVAQIRARSLDKSIDSDGLSRDSSITYDEMTIIPENGDSSASDKPSDAKRIKLKEKTPLSEEFTLLLDACRAADSSSDMESLINKKLIKYYQSVHPDFVNSKSFCKNVLSVVNEINAQPHLVCLKISGLLEELKTRRKSGQLITVDEEIAPSTGDARKDLHIRRLNSALCKLKKRIAKLDAAEVNWDDEDNSQYMISERYKKRAWEIYEKICDITGESKNAQRLVKKPVKFDGTEYAEFNRALQRFVNYTQSFPDMFDVLRCLQHCNMQYNYGLSKDDCKKIAQIAFHQIGTTLQKRRKTDLYEMVSYFTGTDKDPALEDPELQTKLNENQKYHKRIREIIDKYTLHQDVPIAAESTSQHNSDKNVNYSNSDNKDVNLNSTTESTPMRNGTNNVCADPLDQSVEFIGVDTIENVLNSKCSSASTSASSTPRKNPNLEKEYQKFELPSIVSVTSLYPNFSDPTFEDNKIVISDEEDL